MKGPAKSIPTFTKGGTGVVLLLSRRPMCRQGLSIGSLTVGAGSGNHLESVAQSRNTVGVTQDGGECRDAWLSIRLVECLEKDNGQSRFR